MNKQADLEAALAQAQLDWERANEELENTRAELIRANEDWDQVVNDRRKADRDRRKPGAVWDRMFPDRRKSERRSTQADAAALAKAVADRNDAYTRRSKAEGDWAAAEARLEKASAARDRAAVALDEFRRSAN